jgi:predicted alpha/beta-fold hydrolase
MARIAAAPAPPDAPMPAYRPPSWLPSGHAQTIYPALWLRRRRFQYRRQRWTTPDKDFIDLDWIDVPSADTRAPLVALFHGLEGSSDSHYAVSLMDALRRRGWHGVVVHFRGCSGAPNLLARAYHSGDTEEIDWILARLRAGHPRGPVYACGVSLGGNALLKWLGERGDVAARSIDAACTVCVPYDLGATGDHLARGLNSVYTRHFLVTLKAKSLAKLARFPGLYDAAALRRIRTLREFDDLVTAPLHGFRDTDDYWTRAASRPWLRAIRLPTLALSARNDPFVPASALPASEEFAPAVTFDVAAAGGHAGFVSGAPPGRVDWMPERLLAFLEDSAAR